MNFWTAIGLLVLATLVMIAGLSLNGKTEQAGGGHDGHGHDDHGHGHGGHH